MKRLSIDSTAQELASQLVKFHFDNMYSHIPGIIENSNIEPAHKFRVASRRLRSVLETFGNIFAANKMTDVVTTVEKIVPITGKARDLDVYCIFIEEYLTTIPKEDQKGVRFFLRELQEMRRNLQPALVEEVKSLQEPDFIAEFQSLLNQGDIDSIRTGNDLKLTDVGIENHTTFQASTPISVVAYQVISHCVEELASFEDKIDHPQNRKTLHKMRISAKNLRYNLEAFEDFYPSTFPSYIMKMKKIQDYLGIIHDRDVQIIALRKRIRSYVKQELQQFKMVEQLIRQPTIKLECIKPFYRKIVKNELRGLVRLLNDQVHNREWHYVSFIKHWETEKNSGFLTDIVASHKPY